MAVVNLFLVFRISIGSMIKVMKLRELNLVFGYIL